MFRSGVRVALLVLIASGSVAAQTRLIDQARALYYAAAYQQALSVLERVDVSSASEAVTVQVYRAACLLALGRPEEADLAFEKVVTLSPEVQPDQLEMAPSVTSRFAAVRARALLRVEQQREAQARPAEVPAATLEQSDFYTIDDVAVSRPTPLQERVPEPPATRRIDFSGSVTLQVDIAADGSVEGVSLEGTIHPIYDAMIREAATKWRYQPATLDAQPVKFRKALKIQIR